MSVGVLACLPGTKANGERKTSKAAVMKMVRLKPQLLVLPITISPTPILIV